MPSVHFYRFVVVSPFPNAISKPHQVNYDLSVCVSVCVYNLYIFYYIFSYIYVYINIYAFIMYIYKYYISCLQVHHDHLGRIHMYYFI